MNEESSEQKEMIEKALQLKKEGIICFDELRLTDALKLFELALVIIQKLDNNQETANILNYIASSYEGLNDLNNAKDYYLLALNLTDQTKFPSETAFIYANYGSLLDTKKLYSEAKENYEIALKLTKDMKNSFVRAKTLNRIAWLVSVSTHENFTLGKTYFEEAILIYDNLQNMVEKATVLNNLGVMYEEKNELSLAKKFYNESLELYEKHGNPLDKAHTLANLGEIAQKEKEKDLAFKYYEQAITLFEKDENVFEIAEPLKNVYQLDPERSYQLALRSPSGILWLSMFVNEKTNNLQFIDAKLWGYNRNGVDQFWKSINGLITTQKLNDSIYLKNWRFRHILQSTDAINTLEKNFNYIIGCNDLNSEGSIDLETINTAERSLLPLWFIELPLELHHKQKYLKIRVNNLIYSNGMFISVPTIKNERNSSIKRLQLTFTTQWLQELSIDHIFFPNSEEEQEMFIQDPNKAWLSDVYIMDLGSEVQKRDSVDLTYQIKIFFTDAEKPSISLLRQRLRLDIKRTNRYQRLEKYKKTHENALAVFLAISSIAFTFFTQFFNNIRGVVDSLQYVYVLFGIAFLIPLLLLFGIPVIGSLLLLFKPTRKTKQENLIQKYAKIE